ncbi:MAG: ABATE domain-containing protein [bacterium]
MSETGHEVKNLKRVGGVICLDFANTVNHRRAEEYEEVLRDYEDLVVWSGHAGILTKRQTEALLRGASWKPAEAKRAYTRAIELREALYRTFSAWSRGCPVDPIDLDRLNAVLSTALGHLRLESRNGGFAWAWHGVDEELNLPAWIVARSAAELLSSDRLPSVHECAGDNCGWVFLDVSRNHSRRWCDMADCGNRAKARRHYARKRGPTAANG